TSLSTPELLEGFERGLIESVSNVCVYEGDNLFAGYVDYFYNARLNARAKGDVVRDALFKMFLTNLYGKFGQKNDTWEKIDDADPHEVREVFQSGNEGMEFLRIFGGGVWAKNTAADDQEAFNSFPAIAAHVTAYARMLNWRIIETAGRENVYYTDTDSFFVNSVGEVNLREAGLIDNKRLGAVKLEKTGFLWLNGCKDYVGVWETNKVTLGKDPRGKVPHLTRSVRRRLGSTWRWGHRQVHPGQGKSLT
ncbi:DNA polymerase, partial [Bacillus subtilis]|uniref:DNA polymerase n=1 Tax=Bacillus subtilis TaxID=1423 RepID=UPI003F7B908B